MLKSKMTNSKKILIITPILIVLIVLAFAPQFLRPYHLSILRDVLMWMALAISWHFFSGLTKYVTLGSTAFVGTGIYFTGKYLQYSVGSKMYAIYPVLPLPIIMLLAGLICFAVALVIGLATLRLKGIYFAILTFGVGMVLPGVFMVGAYDYGQTSNLHPPIQCSNPILFDINSHDRNASVDHFLT